MTFLQTGGEDGAEERRLSTRRSVGILPRGLASDIRGTSVTEYSAGIASDHSALMPADLITLAHFSVSAAMCLPKSVGEPPNGVAPRSASRACILASDRC